MESKSKYEMIRDLMKEHAGDEGFELYTALYNAAMAANDLGSRTAMIVGQLRDAANEVERLMRSFDAGDRDATDVAEGTIHTISWAMANMMLGELAVIASRYQRAVEDQAVKKMGLIL